MLKRASWIEYLDPVNKGRDNHGYANLRDDTPENVQKEYEEHKKRELENNMKE